MLQQLREANTIEGGGTYGDEESGGRAAGRAAGGGGGGGVGGTQSQLQAPLLLDDSAVQHQIENALGRNQVCARVDRKRMHAYDGVGRLSGSVPA